MLWLFFACSGPAGPGPTGSDCSTVYQMDADGGALTSAAGYEYCAEADDGRGAFHRTGSATCEESGFCDSDAACSDSQVCVCGSGVTYDDGAEVRRITTLSQCVNATCRTDEDCDGLPCMVHFDVCGAPKGLFCRTPADTCATDADCAANASCAFDGAKWTCAETSACE